jgi:hypothetical protein
MNVHLEIVLTLTQKLPWKEHIDGLKDALKDGKKMKRKEKNHDYILKLYSL